MSVMVDWRIFWVECCVGCGLVGCDWGSWCGEVFCFWRCEGKGFGGFDWIFWREVDMIGGDDEDGWGKEIGEGVDGEGEGYDGVVGRWDGECDRRFLNSCLSINVWEGVECSEVK